MPGHVFCVHTFYAPSLIFGPFRPPVSFQEKHLLSVLTKRNVACPRRSDSSPLGFSRSFPRYIFARAPLSERLEQAKRNAARQFTLCTLLGKL